ncbi:alpha/beta hydrolase [Nocardia sp. NPDC049190]|uniref:alpha/beta fold hydrolase n=1 Tax=Nocardia sp. NPDC049190 TaxID=3155650 RepID=UPI0034036852
MSTALIHGKAPVNGTTLAYTQAGPREGRRRPVVFSHPLFFNRTQWYELMARYAELGHPVYTYDHRGQGESARAVREDLSIATLTEDAAAFIEQYRLQGCHFVGASLGGFVALWLAALRPDLVSTVTAIGSSAEEEYKRADYEPLVDHLTAHGPTQVVDPILNIMFSDWTLENNHSLTTTWRAVINCLDQSIGDASHGVITRPRIVEKLHNCAVPVLAIGGDDDHAYPGDISGENIANAVGRHGRHVRIEHAGHSAALEQCEAVARHLDEQFAFTDGV